MSLSSPFASAPQTLESPVPAPITALVRLLDQFKDVIRTLDAKAYAAASPGKPSGSIGAHVRHCLGHVTAFLEGLSSGALSYDRRTRGTRAEHDPRAALDELDELTDALLDLDPSTLDRPLRLDVQLDPSGTGYSVISTAGRELAYVISHTVHHHATMAVLLCETAAVLPDRFGVAAATPSRPTSCAR
jgi:uncharacterized damage-inducible protein DinB